MDFTALVDVGIGLTVVYLGTSLFVTVANEYLASILNWRGERLAEDVQKLIGDKTWHDELATVPAFRGLFSPLTKRNWLGWRKKPEQEATDAGAKPSKRPPAPAAPSKSPPAPVSYIDSALLAEQLVGRFLLRQSLGESKARDPRSREGASSPFDQQLDALWLSSEKVPSVFVVRLSGWIEKSLTSMGEVYKRKLQTSSFLIGLFLASALNLDTVHIAAHLWEDKESRAALALIGSDVARSLTSAQLVKCSKPDSTTGPTSGSSAAAAAAPALAANANVAPASDSVSSSNQSDECAMVSGVMRLVANRAAASKLMPMGWPVQAEGFLQGLRVIAGWILTALAVSLGATFWFDSLKRLVNLRHGMAKP